jgi:DNA polymerase-3 subunit beta
MKVRAERGRLVDALAIAGRAVSTRSSLQVLSGVLLQADEKGLELSATDMEISIRTPIDCTVDEPGSVVLNARVLTDIAKSLAEGEVVIEQRAGESQVEIHAGGSLFSLHSQPAGDFPGFPVFPVENGFTVEKEAFLDTIDMVARSASRDETRPVLTGVLIHVTKSTVQMVATDSYRLSMKETAVKASVADRVEAIIPARSLLELSRIGRAAAVDTLTVIPGENQVLFDIGGVWLISRLIDGQFPNYRQLLPESFDHEVEVDQKEFLDVVHRVGLMAQRNAPIRLRFAENTLTVSAESQDVGRARESFPIRYAGEELEIGFNPEFLEDGARVAGARRSGAAGRLGDGGGAAAGEGDEGQTAAVSHPESVPIYLKFISPLRPGLLQGESEDFLYIIMPIRLTD